MPRYAAFLRAVSPMNASMAQLRAAFEAAGFTDVKTVLSSGNVVFTAGRTREATLERRAEAAMAATMGTAFLTIVRPVDALREMLASDPFQAFSLPVGAKRIVTFLRAVPTATLELPMELEGATILAIHGREVFTAYVPNPRGAAFMRLIEKALGKEVTTRAWDTVVKVAR
jgi:uncharacterized protein (DUF1697 family)